MPRAAPIVSRAAGSRVVVLGLAICLLGAGYEFSLNLPTSPEPHRSDSAGSRKSSQDLDAVQVDDFTLVLPSDGTERVLFVESDQSSRGGVPRVEVDDSVQPEVSLVLDWKLYVNCDITYFLDFFVRERHVSRLFLITKQSSTLSLFLQVNQDFVVNSLFSWRQ